MHRTYRPRGPPMTSPPVSDAPGTTSTNLPRRDPVRQTFLLVGLSLILANTTAWAGVYSGPTDTTNSIDPAIPSTSTRFVEWANAIDPARTYFAPRGSTAISATGYNSLGDLDASQIAAGQSPGFLTVTFPTGIRNGSGADFAMFENGFTYGSPNGLFMELAYVEVSSNGTDFVRFPSISTNTAPVAGSGAFAGYDTSNVYNLAGKNAAGYGTPFDLADLLSDASVLSGAVDLSAIQYVKLVDIPGNGSFLDSRGHPILDNWLTTGSGGFDFRLPVGQGVGVINAIPEPGSLVLLASGMAAALTVRCRRRKSRHGKWFLLNKQSPLSKETSMRFVASDMLRCLLVLGGLVLATSKATAGIVDFDDLTPTTPYAGPGGGAYWNGSDASGRFASRGVQFLNNYDSGYSSWNGWSYSNTTDATTAGITNQYSAYTGGAYSGTNYGVYYAPWTPTQTVTATAPGTFQGMYVTNITYAALSMLNGDSFAKRFGGASGNDQDWFLLTITGRNASGAATGMVDFYLADYRFENNAKDYMVDDWTFVDLTSLGENVKSLEFALTSSDVGAWGMNTPAYFAMDSLTVVPEPSALVLLCGAGISGAAWCYRRRLRLRAAVLSTMECG